MLCRQYTEFAALHDLLCQQAPDIMMCAGSPPGLPPKLLWVSEEELEERRQGLCVYLEAVLSRTELRDLPCVREFLRPEHGAEARHPAAVIRREQRVCSTCSEHAPAEIRARANLLCRRDWREVWEESDEAFASNMTAATVKDFVRRLSLGLLIAIERDLKKRKLREANACFSNA